MCDTQATFGTESMNRTMGYRFAIDRGGTFTDIYARLPDGTERIMKLLSEDPDNYPDAPFEGIKRLMAACGEDTTALSGARIESIRMGTTVATNALLERNGTPTLLVISAGLEDLLCIGDQSRKELFNLRQQNRPPLYRQVLEVAERIRPCPEGEKPTYTGTDGSGFICEQRPDADAILPALQQARAEGCRSVAVIFAHSHLCPIHEQLVQEMAQQAGFEQISLSHEVMPIARMVPRGHTCVVDAYLTPAVMAYARNFRNAFSDGLRSTELLFMASDGGLLPQHAFNGSRALLSGPAGGVVGFARTAFNPAEPQAVIGFDMGGTSTDVSRFAGDFDLIDNTSIDGIPIQLPQLDIRTVAAGGGSRLFFRHGIFVVGPESAGSHPGPVCYRKQGHLAVTDANLVLGRLQPGFFPQVFGVEENQPLDLNASRAAFMSLGADINQWLESQGQESMSLEEIAAGFLDVANEVMARPIREVSVQRGFDLTEHTLACFGGAGGQHACAMARKLGIRTIHIHRYAGVLSAYGMELAPQSAGREQATSGTLTPQMLAKCRKHLHQLETQTVQELTAQGYPETALQSTHYLQLRYQGTDQGLLIATPAHGDYALAFTEAYQREFGFNLNRAIEVDHLRVRTSTASSAHSPTPPPNAKAPKPLETTQVFFRNCWHNTPVYHFDDLSSATIHGPALLIQATATIVVEPDFCARLDSHGDLIISAAESAAAVQADACAETVLNPVQLALYSNRFMSIAEQMGKVLQRTAISTNIKERCDFSCALFDRSGNLVANAPHTPVHLGAMSEAVKAQMQRFGSDIVPGDVILSNHPVSGGSHLPDMTIITPVWRENAIVAYVANRGHHADIGGLTPGSMPAFSAFLSEEGCSIHGMKIVSAGTFMEQEIRSILNNPGKDRYGNDVPGCRCIEDNISDLRAQVAANVCGVNLLLELISRHGLPGVHAYMEHIQDHAEHAVRNCLQHMGARHLETGGSTGTNARLNSEDRLDDGSRIALELQIDPAGNAIFDFSATDGQHWGNLNTPRAVTISAVLYCLRCLVAEEIPLNQGCLRPVMIKTPQHSLLNPAADLGVVGGNVLTSQRIVDVVLRAFDAVAASQGCMNNLTFGAEGFGYYETIGGGSGAGSGWNGASGIHTHMTNTRITDIEILEQRYPVMVATFALRRGSGGQGHWHGGDGLVREILFLQHMQAAILSERRVFSPYGLHGGSDGLCGRNLLLRSDGSRINLGSKNSIIVHPGDRIRIETPGGGGYGKRRE